MMKKVKLIFWWFIFFGFLYNLVLVIVLLFLSIEPDLPQKNNTGAIQFSTIQKQGSKHSIDELLAEMEIGVMAFNVPEHMNIKDSFQISVNIKPFSICRKRDLFNF